MTIILYVKTHNTTGLKYFGKTERTDVAKYRGSGKYWLRHLRTHGNNVTTEVVGSFEDRMEASCFAIDFSNKEDIVRSPLWANLMVENAIEGAPMGHEGHKFTENEREKVSKSSKERWKSREYRDKVIESHKRRFANGFKAHIPVWDDARKLNQSRKIREIAAMKKAQGISVASRKGHKNSKGHCEGISKGLSGKPKSLEHKLKLAWGRLVRFNPNLLDTHENYGNLCLDCLAKYQMTGSICAVSRVLGISETAVKAAIKNSNAFLLKGGD